MKKTKRNLLLASTLLVSLGLGSTALGAKTTSQSTDAYALGSQAEQNLQAVKSLMQTYQLDANQLEQVSYDLGISLNQLRQLESELSTKQSQKDQLQYDIRSLRNQNQSNRQELQQKESRLPQVEQRIANLRQDKNALQRQVQQEERSLQPIKQRLQIVSKKLMAANSTYDRLVRQKSSIEKQVKQDQATVRSTNAKVQKNKSSIAALERQASKAQTNIDKAQAVINANNQKIKPLNQEIKKIQAQMKGLGPRDPKKRELAQKLRPLMAKKNKIVKANQGQQTIIARNKISKSSSEKKAKRLALANERLLVDKKVAQQRLNKSEPKLAKLNQEIRSAQAEKQQAKAKYDKVNAKYSQASSKLKQLERSLSQTQNQLSKVRSRKRNLEQDIRQLQSSIDRGRDLIQQKRSNLQYVESDIARLQPQVQRADSEVQRLRSHERVLADKLMDAQANSHNGKLLHVAVGATEYMSKSLEDKIMHSMQQGTKVVVWVQKQPSSNFVYNYGNLLGLQSTQKMNVSSIEGVNILSQVLVDYPTEQIALEVPSSSIPLMLGNGYAMVSAKVDSYGGVLVTSGVDALSLRDQDLIKMIRKINKASANDILNPGQTEPPAPVDPPSSVVTEVYDLSSLNLAIPDNDANGIDQKIVVDAKYGKQIVAMELNVNIAHTYIGDLKVELIHPSGKSIVLHSNQGGGTDNLQIHADQNALAAFNGLEAAGKYSLVVTDSAARDTGYIQDIQLKISFQ